MGDSSSDEDPEHTIANDVVVTKYKMVGDMVNRVLKKVIDEIKDGAFILDLCELGDTLLLEETKQVYKKDKELKKGIAFPTCISVNNCVCHFSPLRSQTKVAIKDGDLVKIDLGAHIDGYIAVCAHTIVVGASADKKVTGRKADAILAAYNSSEATLRKMKADVQNTEITELIQKTTESFQCKPVQGMLSHQLKKDIINGTKSIIQNPTDDQKREHEKCSFEVHEVYAIDVLVSTAEGKAREVDTRTSVYKKTDQQYNLKLKASRNFFGEVNSKCGFMPFTLRLFEEEGKARMGVNECVQHGLVEPYPVFYDKEGEFVAQFKYTVLLMPNGPLRITDGQFDPTLFESEHKIEDAEIKALLSQSVSKKAIKKKKKKAAVKAAEAAEQQDAPELVNADE